MSGSPVLRWRSRKKAWRIRQGSVSWDLTACGSHPTGGTACSWSTARPARWSRTSRWAWPPTPSAVPGRSAATSATGAATHPARTIRRRHRPARRSALIRVPRSPITARVSVLEVDAGKWRQRKSIRVGPHPCGMIASKDGSFVYVASANSDTVSVLDTRTEEVVETIPCRPEARLPFGSGSNALALVGRRRHALRRQRHQQLHRRRPPRCQILSRRTATDRPAAPWPG